MTTYADEREKQLSPTLDASSLGSAQLDLVTAGINRAGLRLPALSFAVTV